MLALQGHADGWGLPVGGSQLIADALAEDLIAHGGEIVLNHEISSLRELEPSQAVFFYVSPGTLARIAADKLAAKYRHRLERFKPGTGVAKADFALSDPVPWSDPTVLQSATVHLGGTRREIARAENTVHAGRHAESPYVLVTQPSLFDATRAPAGKHVLWTYIHVPAGSTLDPTETVIAQIEKYAPEFRDTILDSAAMTAQDFEEYNPNYVGGNISGGEISISQLIKRPVLSPSPWRTPLRGVFLCSASTPPGPAVHGMAGWYAARQALADIWGIIETLPSVKNSWDRN